MNNGRKEIMQHGQDIYFFTIYIRVRLIYTKNYLSVVIRTVWMWYAYDIGLQDFIT